MAHSQQLSSKKQERDYIPEKKGVPIASRSSSSNSNKMKFRMMMMSNVVKRENKSNNRYYNEDLDSNRMEKLLIKYDSSNPYEETRNTAVAQA